MEILEMTIYIAAYTIGVIVLFLEIVCYKKKIEYIETIFVTTSFLLLIFSLSIYSLFYVINETNCIRLNTFVIISMVLLGLTTPLSIFAERQIKISPFIKMTLYLVSGILLFLIVGNLFFHYQPFIDILASVFLVVSVISSMLIVINSKPKQRVKHREKIEKRMAIVILIVIPISLFIEFFSKKVQFLSFISSEVSLTIPLLFIILATSKYLDNLTRLSLFKTDNSVKQQNIANYHLTQREQEIAALLIKGYSYTKISCTLYISMPTVKTHITNIYNKTGVSNKMELFNALSN